MQLGRPNGYPMRVVTIIVSKTAVQLYSVFIFLSIYMKIRSHQANCMSEIQEISISRSVKVLLGEIMSVLSCYLLCIGICKILPTHGSVSEGNVFTLSVCSHWGGVPCSSRSCQQMSVPMAVIPCNSRICIAPPPHFPLKNLDIDLDKKLDTKFGQLDSHDQVEVGAAWAVRLLRSRRRTGLSIYMFKLQDFL